MNVDLQAKFQDQVFVTYLVVILVFAVSFPAYFAIASSNSETTELGGGISSYTVNFTETVLLEETAELWADDGESDSYDFIVPSEFEVPKGTELAGIMVTLTYDETDESSGPGRQTQCDDIEASIDISSADVPASGHSLTASLTDCDAGILSVFITSNYTGMGYLAENVTRSDIVEMWQDYGMGHGIFTLTITVDTNTGSIPGPGPNPGPLSNNEDGEEVVATFQLIGFELDIQEYTPIESE